MTQTEIIQYLIDALDAEFRERSVQPANLAALYQRLLDLITGVARTLERRIKELEQRTDDIEHAAADGIIIPGTPAFPMSRDAGEFRYTAKSLDRTLKEFSAAIPVVSHTAAGLMSAFDKQTLSNLMQSVAAILQNPGIVPDNSAQVIDRGPWSEGASYYASDLNPDSDIIEISDAWRYGCRWRAPYSHVADSSNAPGYLSDWVYISGPRDIILKSSMPGNTAIMSSADRVDVIFSLMIGQEDITGNVSAWEIARISSDAAADKVWKLQHQDFAGQIQLSRKDFFPADKGVFEVTAEFPDPSNPQSTMRKSIRLS